MVDNDDIPAVVEIGGLSFVVDELLDSSVEDVELVRLDAEEAERALRAGDVLATITIPDGFIRALRGMLQSPELRLEFSNDLLGTRILSKVESLVFSINRTLQETYINTNLVYVDLLTDGGTGEFAGNPFDIIGLNEAGARLRAIGEENPELSAELAELETFVNEGRSGDRRRRGLAQSYRTPNRAGRQRYLGSRRAPLEPCAVVWAGADARVHRRGSRGRLDCGRAR